MWFVQGPSFFFTPSEKELDMPLKFFQIFHGPKSAALALALVALLVMPGIASASANVIAIHNPSFEDNTITTFPGYGAIKDWKSTDTTKTGVNVSGGPFADNGAIPNGSQVAFIQSNDGKVEALSQTLSGFVPGKKYVLRFYYNARYATFAAAANPRMVVKIGSSTLTPVRGVTVTPVSKQTGNTPYHVAKYYYTATGTTATLTFSDVYTAYDPAISQYYDSTILLDDVSLRLVSGKLHHK